MSYTHSMLGLVVLILFGILIAIFATQNTNPVNVTLANYSLSEVPVYFIALAGLLVGVVASWILSLIGAISSGMKLHGKDTAISNLNKTVTDQQKRIRELEVENAKLHGEHDSTRPRLGFANKV